MENYRSVHEMVIHYTAMYRHFRRQRRRTFFAAIAIVAGPENGDLVPDCTMWCMPSGYDGICDYETFPIILGTSPKD